MLIIIWVSKRKTESEGFVMDDWDKFETERPHTESFDGEETTSRQNVYTDRAEAPQRIKKEKNTTPYVTKKFFALMLVVCMVISAAIGAGAYALAISNFGGTSVDKSVHTTYYNLAKATGSELSIEEIVAKNENSVVAIETESVATDTWLRQYVTQGAGSGVIISSDGYILTCAHVVSGASNITVSIGDKDYPATLVGEDTTSDIAVVKVDATGLTPATVGNSDSLKVGESVMAVGNPLGELGGTVTSGIVSALNRSVSIQGSSSVNTMSLIQMDASVSPGNSGGGLFNMNGELVGIVNAKSSDSDAEGLGFAIPVNDAVKVAQELLENGYVTGRPYLGISYYAVTDAQTAAQLGVNAYGVYIVEVVKGGPADKAGLQAGDRIVSVDGSEVATQSDLGTLMQNHKAGDTIEITVARGGQMQTVTVTLGEKGADNS